MLLAHFLSRTIKFGRFTVVDADGRVHHFGSDDGGPMTTSACFAPPPSSAPGRGSIPPSAGPTCRPGGAS